MINGLLKTVLAAFTLCWLTACINEDLSECGIDYEVEYKVTVQTNVTTELSTELRTEAEVELGKELAGALEGFFSDRAHDLNLTFYDMKQQGVLSHHESHIIDANAAVYTLYLPPRDYRHLSVANELLVPTVSVENAENFETLRIRQTVADTVDSHPAALFAARMNMEIQEGIDQVFNVRLYMQNAAVALLIDPLGCEVTDYSGYLGGLATSFAVNDSVYAYDHSPVVRTERLDLAGNPLLCLHGQGFPSPDTFADRPASQHQRATTQDNGLWHFDVYLTLAGGSVTHTRLYFSSPLRAGEFRIVKAQLSTQGEVLPESSEVGTSVEIDWKPGGEYTPDL